MDGQQAAETHGKTRGKGDILKINEQHGDVPIPGIVQFIQAVGGSKIGFRYEGEQIVAVLNCPGDVLVPLGRGDDALVVPDAEPGGFQPADRLRGRIGVAVGITEKQIWLFPLIGGERTVFKKHDQ